MIEILAQIKAPHFTASIVLWDDEVVEAAPIVRYMKKGKWTRAVVRAYCKAKGWEVSVIRQEERSTELDRPYRSEERPSTSPKTPAKA